MMSKMTGISEILYNKCPKWLVEQISSYSDYFNVIFGFTSNSRAPGGPVTIYLEVTDVNHLLYALLNYQHSILELIDS